MGYKKATERIKLVRNARIASNSNVDVQFKAFNTFSSRITRVSSTALKIGIDIHSKRTR